MTSNTESTLQASAIMPGLTVNDLQKSIAFYEGLGFAVGQRWEDDDGTLKGVMMSAGAASLGLSQDDGKKGLNRVKGTAMRMWIATDQDVDVLAAGAKSHGLTLEKEPYDTGWGSRAFDVVDPDGFPFTLSKGA